MGQVIVCKGIQATQGVIERGLSSFVPPVSSYISAPVLARLQAIGMTSGSRIETVLTSANQVAVCAAFKNSEADYLAATVLRS